MEETGKVFHWLKAGVRAHMDTRVHVCTLEGGQGSAVEHTAVTPFGPLSQPLGYASVRTPALIHRSHLWWLPYGLTCIILAPLC